MSKAIWLASYPKSGNTWVRAFLSSVEKNGEAIDINQMAPIMQPSARHVLDDILGIATSDLTKDEILLARPAALAAYCAIQKDHFICKVHEAWMHNGRGIPLFPAELTQASVYIVRDPRDVAISFAHHLGKSIDHAIDFMADPDAMLSRIVNHIGPRTSQPLLSWSQHVNSWLDQANPAPLLVRYESMLENPLLEGIRIAQHTGLQKEISVYERAVKHSSFSELSKQENNNRFKEASNPDRVFFRAGTAGNWQTKLSTQQITRIENAHGTVMTRLGYL
jgi:aryl sulfotransferase